MGRRGSEQRVERLEEDVGGRDEGDAADPEPVRPGVRSRPDEQRVAQEIYAMGRNSLYLHAKDELQYIDLATRLVRDAQLRRAAGEANRRFVAEFLSDRARTARILSTHLLELIAEARQRA